MKNYLIVTDTTSAMNGVQAKESGVELVSLSVLIDGIEYKDQIDISTEELYKKLDAVEKIDEDYMEYVDTFCEKYCKYIEGGNPEYFRYPEYKSSQYFAGNCLDAKWLFYNFALILLKLLHLADLEKEI